MKHQNLTHILPATRVTEEMRTRTEMVAKAAGCDFADVVRDALENALLHLELQLGLTTIDDYDDETLEAAGLGRAVEEKRARRVAEEIGGDDISTIRLRDRTRGSAWGAPVVPPADRPYEHTRHPRDCP